MLMTNPLTILALSTAAALDHTLWLAVVLLGCALFRLLTSDVRR